MFHADQSIYLEFGTIGRYNLGVLGSNGCRLPDLRLKVATSPIRHVLFALRGSYDLLTSSP